MSAAHNGIGMTSQRTRERLIQRLRAAGVHNERVLEAMRNTPRHLFVDEALAIRAYDDMALPIGFGQTLSHPHSVASMLQAMLAGRASLNRVLEIGTGSGYQTTVLAQLAAQVYSVERIEFFVRKARQRFRDLQLRTVRVKHGDGSHGWLEYGPYDGIIVSAAPAATPQALLEQLAVGGRLVIPVGNANQQTVRVIAREAQGFDEAILADANFVPLRPGAGSQA